MEGDPVVLCPRLHDLQVVIDVLRLVASVSEDRCVHLRHTSLLKGRQNQQCGGLHPCPETQVGVVVVAHRMYSF